MKICYYCGKEIDKLYHCDKCKQEYCSLHIETQSHDCPLFPIQNPYELGGSINQETDSFEQSVEQSVKNIALSDSEEIDPIELNQKDFEDVELTEEELQKVENTILPGELNDEIILNQINNSTTIDNSNKDYDEIEVDLEGVFDIEHDHKDPDGFHQPIQVIKENSPYRNRIKIKKNNIGECYFCNKPTNEKEGGTFIKCRNLEESFIKGMGRGIIKGIKSDGFWICSNPECMLSWNSNEPVYLTFKSNKAYKFNKIN